MNKKALYIIIFLIFQAMSNIAIAAIGDWKAYMAYSDVQEIEQAGNLVFVQASNDLYVYNKNDQSIQTFSKIDYLNDCEIQHITYNKASQRLLIIYTNGNIDLMNVNNYEVTNLSDYQNATTTGDKTVNDIYMNGKYAYLSNGFGIVKVNVADGEISDTYNLGFAVNWCEIDGNTISAYSASNGKYSASLTDNLLDKSNWKKVGGYAAKQQEDKSELKQLVSTLNPGGPKYNYFWDMKFINNKLYTCGGGYYSGISRPGCIQILSNNSWNHYSDSNISETTKLSYKDLTCLAVSPLDSKTVFVGGRNGLYEFQDGIFQKLYNNENSPIESYSGKNKEYELVLGINFDSEGNLWVLNSQSPTQAIIKYSKEKEWTSLYHSDLMKLDDEAHNLKNKSLGYLRNVYFDHNNLMWFVNAHWTIPSFYCYQSSNDYLKAFTSFTNEDGATINVNYVNCITEDNENNIWIGTSAGPLMLKTSEITADSPILTQVKVPRNDGTNYADYLLSDINISCIAIDKANRKWFGTSSNGVFLIGSNNIEQLQHFTSTNSPLLSDNIESIAINDTTGEIFFGTDKGLCSYLSDVSYTNREMNKDNVWAYPNPVKPNYTGNITICGLAINSDVKILTSNGVLVNQGKSNAGTYKWDGNDLNGKKVASGIYMVATATQNGEKGTVCKIAIIN